MHVGKVINRSKLKDYINDGDVLLVGGFGMSGTPLTLIDELSISGRKDLTVVSNNLGEAGKGLESYCILVI